MRREYRVGLQCRERPGKCQLREIHLGRIILPALARFSALRCHADARRALDRAQALGVVNTGLVELRALTYLSFDTRLWDCRWRISVATPRVPQRVE